MIVAPSGIETAYISLSIPSFLHNSIFTGILAAELLVKKAVIPDSLKHLKINGYGLVRNAIAAINGSTTNATTNIHPTKRPNNLP